MIIFFNYLYVKLVFYNMAKLMILAFFCLHKQLIKLVLYTLTRPINANSGKFGGGHFV